MKRCMFVDDSSVIRKVAKRILGGSGNDRHRGGSGLDALEMCLADMPDIIVVDGALPDMPAVEFIRRVRAIESPIRPQILIAWWRSTSARSCGPSAPAPRAIC